MADNRFARQLHELDAEEQGLVKPVIAAARASFSGFEERPGSEYHCAPELSPEETWARVAEELARVSALAALQGFRDIPLTLDDVELIHRGIFEPVFGEKTLGLRSRASEKVEFPIVVGKQSAPVIRQRRGSGVKQIRQNLGKAVANFEREVAGLESVQEPALAEAALVAVKLYAKVIGVHPFLDGNGRTAWAIVSYALQRCSLVELAIPPSDTTRWALGQALRHGGSQSYEPLTELIVNAIKDSAHHGRH